MPWFKVDDGLPHHAKIEALETYPPSVHAKALALWLLAGADSAGRLTDGFVTLHRCKKLVPWRPNLAIVALVEIGLWHETDGGWIFHDWERYQPTRENVEKTRECSRERMANVRANSGRSSGEVRSTSRTRPGPTRPDPTRPDPATTTVGVRAPTSQEPGAALVLEPPEPPKPKPKRKPAKPKPPAPSSLTWDAYSSAYLERYGAEPVRNARVNGQLAALVTRLGAEDAPEVARYYLGHNGPYYVRQGHSVAALLGDAEKIRTEWATGRRITSGDAREAEVVDEMQAQSRRVAKLLEGGKAW